MIRDTRRRKLWIVNPNQPGQWLSGTLTPRSRQSPGDIIFGINGYEVTKPAEVGATTVSGYNKVWILNKGRLDQPVEAYHRTLGGRVAGA